MSCGGGLSNFERKKKALIYANRWKSNFIAIWRKYGTFQTVNGVECFDWYRIDGGGEGQKKMSKHLKQPDLWQKAQNDDLEWVHLFFNVDLLIEMTKENIDKWRVYMERYIRTKSFNRLKYRIAQNEVVEAKFSMYTAETEDAPAKDEPVNDAVLDRLAFLIALMEADSLSSGSEYAYDRLVSYADVDSMVDDLLSVNPFDDAYSVFAFPPVEKDIRSWLMQEGIGVDILDTLVVEGVLVSGTIDSTTTAYYVPVSAIKKMNGFAFVKFLARTLDFHYKKEGSALWNFFKQIVGLILAAVAAYFGFFEIAASLLAGFFAGKIDNPYFKIILAVVMAFGGDFSGGFAAMGAADAVSLLLNVYSVYMELKYTAPKADTSENSDTTQEMFYRAPYSAYQGIYCYKDLISVSVRI